MAGSPRRRDRKERLAQLLGDPETLRTLCDVIIEGGTLAEWCRARDVPFGAVSAWIAAEEHRREKFKAAQDLRGEYLSELVVRNLRQFADVDIGKAYGPDGALLPVASMPEDVRRAVASFEVFEEYAGRGDKREAVGQTTKIKLIDPARAVELLGKYRRMFVDQVEHSATLTLEQLLGASRAPAVAHEAREVLPAPAAVAVK